MRYPSLREVALHAVAHLSRREVPRLPRIPHCSLIIGSGNAAATGKALYPAMIHATESDYHEKLSAARHVVLISASGAKHAPSIARQAREAEKRVLLITTNPDAPAKAYAERTIITPAVEEPYTYNTSTYAGMLAMLPEKHEWKQVHQLDKKSIRIIPGRKPRMITFILPARLAWLKDFILTKGDELFAPRIAFRAFTSEEVKHAKTIIPDKREYFILLTTPDRAVRILLQERWQTRLILPEASKAVSLLMTYVLIGRLQEAMPDWFGTHLPAYEKLLQNVFPEQANPLKR